MKGNIEGARGFSARGLNQVFRLGIGLAVAAPVFLFFDPDPANPAMGRMAAVAVLMAAWWIMEAVPLAVTALVPIALFPILGIMRGGQVASSYVNSIIFLFLGGFLIALAMEKWNLHRRIALKIIGIFGVKPSAILLGFMVAAGGLSMWISNTATAVMMLPIGLAIIRKMEETFGKDRAKNFAVTLMLGIAYGCSIGGVATLVGTPPNLVAKSVFQNTFPGAPELAFGQWMLMALPLSIGLLFLTWFLLTRVLKPLPKDLTIDPAVIREEYRSLGPVSFEEKAVLTIFTATALLWVFRSDLELGFMVLPGWGRLLAAPGWIDDGTVAIFMALLLFLIPSRSASDSATILDGRVFRDVPWPIILLFGGGFALADGLVATDLSRYLALQFTGLTNVPPLVTVLMVCLGMTFLTELTSNTASAQMILPILASISVAQQVHPLVLMVPATLSASMAFMLPVATPPNAIIFSSQRVRIAEMARVGIVFNVICAIAITLWVSWVMPLIFGFDPNVFPDWAAQ